MSASGPSGPLVQCCYLWLFLGCNQYWVGGFMVFAILCPGAPESSTGNGSGFKASQKTFSMLFNLNPFASRVANLC